MDIETTHIGDGPEVAAAELRCFQVLQEVQPEERERIAALLKRCSFAAGSLIIRRGDAVECLYLLLEGSARVEQRDESGLLYNLTELHAGDLLGEHALLTGAPRSSDVRAVTPVVAARLQRQDFELLLREIPAIYAGVCRHLAMQLGDWAQRHHRDESEHREVLANLIGWQLLPEFDAFPGNTPAIRALNEQLQRLSTVEEHVLVQGEHGTWKDLAARLIHSHGNPARPVLFLDCAAPPSLHRKQGGDQRSPQDSLVLELAQESALFGHAQDGLHHGRRGRRGMLELANGGDLILRNLQYLTPAVQLALLAFLDSGRFRRRGEQEWRSATVRVIATTSERLAEENVAYPFDQELYARLTSGGLVAILPLRERRKEIPAIARSLLGVLNAKHHRAVKRLSQDALNRLVDHDWPLNSSELYQVVSRAVAMSAGEEIDAEQIYLGGQHGGTGQRLNLLSLPSVERLAVRPDFPRVLRWLTVPLFLLITVYALFGPREHNAANLAVWTLWWPSLLLVVFLFARGWCSVCPLEAVGGFFGLTSRVVREPARWLRRWGPWLAMVGLAAIVLIEQASGMFVYAFGTGLLLAVLLALTLTADLLLGRRGWCKYLCPLGRVVGLFSRMSLLEMHSNQVVCVSRCKVDECIKEKGCPMGLHPTGVNNSDHCVLCLDCVRNCPHHAMQLDLRNPFWGLLSRNRGGYAEALFGLTVIGVTVAAKLTPHLFGRQPEALPSTLWSGVEIAAAVLVVLAYLACGLAASLDLRVRRWRVAVSQFGLAYLPLAFSGLMAIYLRAVAEGGGELIPYLLEAVEVDRLIDPERLRPELGTIGLVIPVTVLLSGLLSWRVLAQIQKRYQLGYQAMAAHRLLVVVTMLLFWWLL